MEGVDLARTEVRGAIILPCSGKRRGYGKNELRRITKPKCNPMGRTWLREEEILIDCDSIQDYTITFKYDLKEI